MHFSTHFNALYFHHKRAAQLYSVVFLQRSDNDISLDCCAVIYAQSARYTYCLHGITLTVSERLL